MTHQKSTQQSTSRGISAIDSHSVHRITSGQVVIDLQTAVKELVENSLDADSTSIEVRFKNYGLKSIEVIDNGSGIKPEDYDAVALKHHTSKLSQFADLTSIHTFGFRGEALSSLCALSESVTVVTALQDQAPMGTILEFDATGRLSSKTGKTARQRGTSVTINNLFKPLPVRLTELKRNIKREYTKALNLLIAYALVPCSPSAQSPGVRLTVSNHPDGGRKTIQLRTEGPSSSTASHSTLDASTSLRTAVSSVWGPKALENIVDLDLSFDVEPEKSMLRRRALAAADDGDDTDARHRIQVRGLVSKFAPSCGRSGTDRQFFYINGRPCNPGKVQKAFNEVYKTFNATQSPFVIADFIIPTDSCDINVSPDKRTILLHSEGHLVEALKNALNESFAPTRSTFDLSSTQTQTQSKLDLKAKPKATAHASSDDVIETQDTEDVEMADETLGPDAAEISTSTPRSISSMPSSQSQSQSIGGQSSSRQSQAASAPDTDVQATPEPSYSQHNNEPPLSKNSDDDASSHPQVNATPPTPNLVQTRPAVPQRQLTTSASTTSTSSSSQSTPGLKYTSTSVNSRHERTIARIIAGEDDGSQSASRSRSRSQSKSGGGGGTLNGVDVGGGGRGTGTGSIVAGADAGKGGEIRNGRGKQQQMTLDGAGAAWSLKKKQVEEDEDKSEDGRESPPKKRAKFSVEPRTLTATEKGKGKEKDAPVVTMNNGIGSARTKLRDKLKGMGLGGAGPVNSGDDERRSVTPDAEEDLEEEMDVDADEGGEMHGQNKAGDDSETDEDDMDMEDTPSSASGPAKNSRSVSDSKPTIPAHSSRAQSQTPASSQIIDLTFSDDTLSEPPTSNHRPNRIRETHEGTASTQNSSDLGRTSQLSTNSTPLFSSSDAPRPEIERTSSLSVTDTQTLSFDLSRVTDKWKALRSRLTKARESTNEKALSQSQVNAEASEEVAGAGITCTDGSKADEVLTRVLHKEDFGIMEVVGQFNLGFIVARRRKGGEDAKNGEQLDDLFIIDQHAADEKYNFETLQQTTKIESQRLFRPRELELTAADELVAMENISVFKQNGFEIIIEDNDMPVGGVDDTKILPAHADERAELGMAVYNDEEGYEVSTELEGQSGSRRRVKLVAQPISGNTVFDVKDFEELLHKMRDLPTGTMVRCSKARAMFASRACRKSIMVGMALENKQMTSVVRHMGTMEQPWNCPHGRPTMRHLTDLKAMKKTKKDRQIDWTGFGMV